MSGLGGGDRIFADDLCAVCKGLNVKILLKNERIRVHEDLEELKVCASECYLCNKAYSRAKAARPLSGSDGPWKTGRAASQFHVTVEYGRWLGFQALLLVLNDHETKSKLKSATSISRANIWLYLKTVEGDPLVNAGIDWVRPLPSNTSSLSTLNVAKTWIENCFQGKCGRVEPSGGTLHVGTADPMPTGLIEPNIDPTGSIKLVHGCDVGRAHYAALSYTWGRSEPTWQSTITNVNARFNSFPRSELPKTIDDAIIITSQLGLRYLWADSLCIVQDDDADWAFEASRMAEVYMNAHVTIAASTSDNSLSGIFNQKSSSRLDTVKHFQIDTHLSTGEKSTVYLLPEYPAGRWDVDVSRAKLSTRAWCCQERLLSPRVLHFGVNQIYWECRHCIRSEDNFEEGRSRRRVDTLFAAIESKDDHAKIEVDPREYVSSASFLKIWYNGVVEKDYSHRNLTYGKDKLIALAGLARAIHSTQPMRYYAGLWEDNLLCGLCWRRGIQAAGKAEVYRATSWSWASQLSRVMYPIEFKEPLMQYAEIKHISVEHGSQDEFGAVSDAKLTISAPTLRGIVGKAIEIPPDGDVIDLAGGYPGREVILESDVVVAGVMDDEEFGNRPIIACGLVRTSWGNAKIMFMLLLEVLEGSTTLYRRVGLVRQAYQPEKRKSDATTLRMLEQAEPRELEIV